MSRASTKDIHVPLLFSDSVETVRNKLPRPALVVVPSSDNWNDYGHQLFAHLYILREGQDDDLSDLSLMFQGEQSTAKYLRTQFTIHNGPVAPNDIGKSFISLQKSSLRYAEIIELLGYDAAISALRALHDAVLANLEDEDTETLSLLEAQSFHIGMTRNASQYVALRRGGQYLRPTKSINAEDAANSFAIAAKIHAASNSYVLKFDFEKDEIFQDRCCILIGRNGVGKTQLLRAIIEGFIEKSNRPSTESAPIAVKLLPKPRVQRVMMFSAVPSDPYPKTIPPWLGVDYEYHPVITDQKPLGKAFLTAILDCLRADNTSFGPAKERASRITLLQREMDKLGLWRALYIPINKHSVNEFPQHRWFGDVPYISIAGQLSEYRLSILFHAIDWEHAAIAINRNYQVRQLSSGELAMANFIAQTVAAIENSSLLLFDEPETHLHPNYISDFMDTLQDLLDFTSSVAIIATHASYVVREVPRQRINILQRRETGEVEIVQPRMQTFGLNVDDISRFVFADGAISHRYQKVLSEWTDTKGKELGLDTIIEQYGATLNSETLSFIARRLRQNLE